MDIEEIMGIVGILYFSVMIMISVVWIVLQESGIRKQRRNIEKYIKFNKFKPYFVNRFVECICIYDEYVCMRAKTDGKKPGKCLLLMGGAALWAIIQKNFNSEIVLEQLEQLLKSAGGTLVEIEGINDPEGTISNEYCRMRLNREEIICSEIWPDCNGKTRSFKIYGDRRILTDIFFAFENSVFEDYELLISKYKQYSNIKIEEIIEKETAKIDINNATLEELKNLPIINIITAKKLIKKREEIDGFKSVQDVCIFLRLTFTQEDRISKLICVKPMKISPAKIKTDERNVDL